jgi:hypothetical protein
MTFDELIERASQIAELGGYTDTANPPDWARLVNLAYKRFCWEADAVWSEDATIDSEANIGEYDIPAPEYKLVTDVSFGTVKLERGSVSQARMWHNEWRTHTAATPRLYWMAQSQVLRVWPTPTTADVTISIYGVRAPVSMEAGDDLPVAVPEVYHEDIAGLAYALHARRMARGAELAESVERYIQIATDSAMRLKRDMAQSQELGSLRSTDWPMTERITL